MVISFKQGKRKAFWDFVDLNKVRIDKIWGLFEWHFMTKKEMKQEVVNVLGDVTLSLFNFRGWHEGTSTYIAINKNGEKFFLKKSRHKEAIGAEVDNINYLMQFGNEQLFETCKVVKMISMEHYAFVIETFLEGHSLNDNSFIEILDEETKEEIIIKLFNCIKEFQRINFIHADFTPKNILITKENKIQIIDFEYSQVVKGKLKNGRLDTTLKRKLIHLGGDYGMENGIYDDAFSLIQIVRLQMPEFIKRNNDIWKEMNLSIGKLQYDIRKKDK